MFANSRNIKREMEMSLKQIKKAVRQKKKKLNIRNGNE